MKRASKIWLMTGVCLVLIGALTFVGVMAANHWDLSALGGAKYETSTYEIREAFNNISIRSDTADISFMPSDDAECRVVYRDRPKIGLSASVRDGTLTIETVDTRKWYEFAAFSFGSSEMEVYLPRSEYASLSIDESTGDIVIPKDLTFESIGVSVSTGDVDCRASSSGPIRIAAGTGNINAENISAGALELSVSTGKVTVRSVVCAGDAGVTVSTGKTTLTDVSCKNLFSDGSTGDITLENVIAEETITVERSTGDVRLDKSDAAELLIKTDTGDVSGTLLSEKIFIVQSDTGRIKVPETTSGGKCKITTDTGDITVAVS